MHTNHGPALTPLSRLERIRAILESAMSAAQKCIGIAIVTYADEQTGTTVMNTTLMQRYASARDADTVYRASSALERARVASVTRERGRPNTYQVMEPEVMASIEAAYNERRGQKSAPVYPEYLGQSGTVKEDRFHRSGTARPEHSGPDRPESRPAKCSGSTAPVLARARDLLVSPSKNNTNTNPDSLPQTQNLDAAREGEESLGEGVFVNCRTVRHRAFTISLESIVMQLRTAGMEKARAEELARATSIANAMQWAAEIAQGKPPGLVVPSNPANLIRGSILRQFGAQIGAPRKQSQAELDAMYEDLERRRLADVERAARARKRH